MSSHNQNEQVQYVYHCCLCLIFDQITMAQEQKYLLIEFTLCEKQKYQVTFVTKNKNIWCRLHTINSRTASKLKGSSSS